MKTTYRTVIFLLAVFGILALFSCKEERTESLSFKDCSVQYKQYRGGEKKLHEGHYITNSMELESAQRKLGMCLCELYMKIGDLEVRNKILALYDEVDLYFPNSATITTRHIDSILKYRNTVFDSQILID